jgi:ankyrin repeat protein
MSKRYPVEYIDSSDFPYYDVNTYDCNKYSHIKNNRDAIMKSFMEESYSEIINFLPETRPYLTYIDGKLSGKVTIAQQQLYDFVSDNLFTKDTNGKITMKTTIFINYKLFAYCLHYNDIDFMKEIIIKTNGYDLLKRIIYYGVLWVSIKYDYEELTILIVNSIKLHKNVIYEYFELFIRYNKPNLFKLFLEKGFTVPKDILDTIISLFCTDIVELLIAYDYKDNIQRLIDNHKGNYAHDKGSQSVKMFKLLYKNGINFSHKINDILIYASEQGVVDLIEYCIAMDTNCDINDAFKASCQNNNIGAMICLLQFGADLNILEDEDLMSSTLDIIKLLIQHDYKLSYDVMLDILSRAFIYGDNVSDIEYLIANGSDINYIFERERMLNEKYRVFSYHEDEYSDLNSHLEFIVGRNKMSYVKFLADKYFNQLSPELNRLYVISSANGQLEMMQYLLALGAEIFAFDNMAFIVACYFGHLNCVEFLLSQGIHVENININLFSVIVLGHTEISSTAIMYNEIVKDHTIFKDDLYNYGYKHYDILKLLIKHNIPIPLNNIFTMNSKNMIDDDIVLYLIDNGFDLNKKTLVANVNSILTCNNYITLLELAVANNKISIVKILLKYGADVNINNNNPIIMAISNGMEDITRLLLEYGANDDV